MTPQKKSPPKRTPDVSDGELVEAVQTACERAGIPVVPASKVADLEPIPIKKDAVKRRLDEIDRVSKYDTGGAFVYWVSEEGEARGNIDPSSIYWENVDPEGIPEEVINEHPEFTVPTRPERLVEKGNEIIGPATLSFIFGAGVLFVQEYTASLIEPGSDVELVGVLAAIAGFSFMFIGFVLVFVGKLGQELEDRGVSPVVREHTKSVLEGIEKRLPISWDRK